MEQSRLRALEEQCIQECPPPCAASCPVHVDVRQMTAAAAKGDFTGAYKVFQKSVPFPGIISHTCKQPCQEKCYRETIGGVIQIAEIEQAAMLYGNEPPGKILLLPNKNAKVAVIGGGLSGLTAAVELRKKGYQVSLFEQYDHLGGRLQSFSGTVLNSSIIDQDTKVVAEIGVEVFLGKKIENLDDLPGLFDAVYLGTGDQESIRIEGLCNSDGTLGYDPVTLQTSRENVFAGGTLLHPHSTIMSLSDGRRAAISIDRFLQRVSLTASRGSEGSQETRLYTNISDIESLKGVHPRNFETGFTMEEAQQEAARCLQCDCMECVKVCEYLRHYGSYPRKYVREIYNNLSIIMRTRTANKFINSCTLCGLCGEVCPTDLDMGKVNLEARQTMVKTNKMPISAHDFALRDMAFSNSERFAATLLPLARKTCTHMLFPGCQLAASNPEYIEKLYQTLSGILPDMGVMLRCCGAPADWSGETEIFQNSVAEFRNEWQIAGSPTLILACSSCNSTIKKQLPEAKTISIWELFEQYNLFPKTHNVGKSYVVHDPCTSRYEPAWQEAVRQGLTAMGTEFHELKMSRDLTECCGYGGVAWLAHPELVHDIIQRRIGEDQADYLTYCVMCRDLFVAEGKPTLHLLDLLFGKDLDSLAIHEGPDYSQRHENRIRVKQKMIKLITGKDQIQVETYEKYEVILSQEMRDLIESRLILVEDIQKVIEHAETSHEFFVNQESGHALACFKPNLITYWVEYSKSGGSYLIHDAYSHRMEIEGDGSI